MPACSLAKLTEARHPVVSPLLNDQLVLHVHDRRSNAVFVTRSADGTRAGAELHGTRPTARPCSVSHICTGGGLHRPIQSANETRSG